METDPGLISVFDEVLSPGITMEEDVKTFNIALYRSAHTGKELWKYAARVINIEKATFTPLKRKTD